MAAQLPVITHALGHNRASHFYFNGENVELWVAYSSSSTPTWKLTKDGKPVVPDFVVKEAFTGVITMLKFQFADGKTTDHGLYEFSVTNGSGTVTQTYDLVSRAMIPVVNVTKPEIFDVRKASLTINGKVFGGVEWFDWIARGEGSSYSNLVTHAGGTQSGSSITFAPDNLSGMLLELQATMYAEQDNAGQLFDVGHLGLFAIPSVNIKNATKLPKFVNEGTAVNLAFTSKMRWMPNMDFVVYAFINGGESVEKFVCVTPADSATQQHFHGYYSLSGFLPAPVNTKPQFANDLAHSEKVDYIVYFPWNGEALYLGSVPVRSAPKIFDLYPPSTAANPIVVKRGTEVTLHPPGIQGTAPLKYAWLYSTDNRRSWKVVSTAATGKFRPLASGIAILSATNAYGSARSEGGGEVHISVQTLKLGSTKSPGMR